MTGITALFPLWAVALSAVAYLFPAPFLPLKGAIIPFLVVIMFGMGITLTARDFHRVLRAPGIIAAGMALQYGIMPLAALLIGRGLGLPTELVVGMVLVGSCPGGTASNVMCYLARADVALSITLTLSSTALAIVMTPLLTELYVGRQVPVPAFDMLLSILKIVVIPVALGVTVNTLFGARISRVRPVFPFVSMAAIVIIIAVIVALSRDKIADMGLLILSAVILHNLAGLAGGYTVARLLGYNETVCRTLAIEIGMQNSGLAVALATKYFSALAALPGALFSIWHNLSGSLLAGIWARGREAR